MLDFDYIEDLAPKFSEALKTYVPVDVVEKFRAAKPEFIEGARDLLFEIGDRNGIIDAVFNLIRSENIVAYHGSRLTDEELDSIRVLGLLPLKAEHRRQRLSRALSRHPYWEKVRGDLDFTIQEHGIRGHAGHREGQVHFALSKSGLKEGFNHYLTHGAEFDQHVAHSLFGPEGTKLLTLDGKARIIRVLIPGLQALDAANPHSTIDKVLALGEVPGLADEFLKTWSYRMAYPEFRSSTLKAGCSLTFHSVVSAAWIVECETLDL